MVKEPNTNPNQPSPGPAGSAPLWYTEEELRHYLKALRHYSDEITSELAKDYAHNLQSAFQKGWEMSQRAQNTAGEPQTPQKKKE